MRWLKHLASAHEDSKIAELLETEGPEAYGVYWLLLETVAGPLEASSNEPQLTHSLLVWAQKFHISTKKCKSLLLRMLDLHLIELQSIRDRYTIAVPNLLKYRDEYQKKSGVSPEFVRRNSSLEQSRAEQKRTEQKRTAASAALPAVVEAVEPVEPAAAAEPPTTGAIHFPESQRLIRQEYPGTDSAMVTRIVATACRCKPGASDRDVVELLIRTHRGKRQETAALWLHTIPAYVEGKQPDPGRPPPVCPECGGYGKVLRPEFNSAADNTWTDLPEERTHVQCPRCRGHTLRKPDEDELELVLVRAKGAK